METFKNKEKYLNSYLLSKLFNWIDFHCQGQNNEANVR